MAELREPEYYMPKLIALRERDHYAKRWKLKVERHTNRHPDTFGGSWGWYEVHPLGIEVGYWGTNRNDLKSVDLAAWNQRAIEADTREGE